MQNIAINSTCRSVLVTNAMVVRIFILKKNGVVISTLVIDDLEIENKKIDITLIKGKL